LKDIPEFKRLQSCNPKEEITSVHIIYCRAIHWLSIFKIIWPPFEKIDSYAVDVRHIVWNDPDYNDLPNTFFEQILIILKSFWTIQLSDLYPDGNWKIVVKSNEEELTISAIITTRKSGKPRFKIPEIYSLQDVPEFQRIQEFKPYQLFDEQKAAVLTGYAIHWIAIFIELWPSFQDDDFHLIFLANLIEYDLDKKELPKEFREQILQIFRTFWQIQLYDLYPEDNWLIEEDEREEGLLQVTIKK
jgi:hypothetical protein